MGKPCDKCEKKALCKLKGAMGKAPAKDKEKYKATIAAVQRYRKRKGDK